jgi:hypothetical protein
MPTAWHMTSGTCGIETAGRNPFRVDENRVPASEGSRQKTRQPWAMLRNAFGVETIRPRQPWLVRAQFG